MAITVQSARFVLQNIETLEKQYNTLNDLVSDYKFQIDNVGKDSSLGRVLIRDLQTIRGDINRIKYRIEEFRQEIVGFDMSLIKDEKTLDEEDEKEESIKNSKEEVKHKDEVKEEIKTEEEINEQNIKQTNKENINNELECDYYKVSCVAAFKEGKIIDVLIIDNEQEINRKVSQLYSEYGSDIDVSFNYDGYKNNEKDPIHENIGWMDIKFISQYIKGRNINSIKQEEKENNTKLKVEEQKVEETKENSTKVKVEEQKENSTKVKTEEEKEYSEFIEMYGLEEDKGIRSLKIVYSQGKYHVTYNIIKDGEIIPISSNYKINPQYIYDKYRKKRRAKKYNLDQKSDIYKYLDLNLLLCLEDIDKKNGTHYANDYMNGILNIKLKYDLKSTSRDKTLKLEDKHRLRLIALKQRAIANANVEGGYRKSALVGAVASFVVLATLGISNFLPSFGKKDSNSTTKNKNAIEQQANVDTTKEINTEEILDDIVNSKGKVGDGVTSITKNVTATINTSVDKKETKEKLGTAINDSFRLIEKDKSGNISTTYILSKGLDENSKKILVSDYNDCDKFKISAIAVCKDGKQLDIITSTDEDSNIRTNDLYEKYGKNIDLFFNFDAYRDGKEIPQYKHIGWLNSSDFKSGDTPGKVKDIAAAQEEIKKHNESINIKETESKETKEEVVENNDKQKEEQENKSDKIETVSNENVEPGYYDFGLEGKIMLAFRDANGNVVSSQKISSDAWGNGKQIDASKIKCDYFKISCIAVYNGSQVLDVETIKDGESVDDITNHMYQKYGADIDISYNFDGYKNDKDESLYEYVGWLNLDKLVNITEDEKVAAANYNKDVAKVKVKK